jgi:hypothetical protein
LGFESFSGAEHATALKNESLFPMKFSFCLPTEEILVQGGFCFAYRENQTTFFSPEEMKINDNKKKKEIRLYD